MKKIPTLFQRGSDGRVTGAVTPGCEWVLAGEGRATRKLDGTCCMVQGGQLYKRQGENWTPVGDGPEDQWHREAPLTDLEDGTYELIGPKVQGNPEGATTHHLVKHGAVAERNKVRTYAALLQYLPSVDIEGIVWHHADGRMAKIKTRDFGLKRGEHANGHIH